MKATSQNTRGRANRKRSRSDVRNPTRFSISSVMGLSRCGRRSVGERGIDFKPGTKGEFGWWIVGAPLETFMTVTAGMQPGPSSDLDSVKRWWSYHDLHEHHPASQAAAPKVLQKLMRFLQTAKNDR